MAVSLGVWAIYAGALWFAYTDDKIFENKFSSVKQAIRIFNHLK